MSKFEDFHIVYSPQDKNDVESKREELISYLDKHYTMWIVSDEVGSSDNRHLDIVGIQLKNPSKAGNESTRLKKVLEIKGRYELKCYGIDEGQLNWQIGYNVKEGGICETSEIFDFDLEECLEIYKNNPQGINGRKVKTYEKKWTLDTLGEAYLKYLEEKKILHNNKNFKEFMKINKKNWGLSLLHKINNLKIDEFMIIMDKFDEGEKIPENFKNGNPLGAAFEKSEDQKYLDDKIFEMKQKNRKK